MDIKTSMNKILAILAGILTGKVALSHANLDADCLDKGNWPRCSSASFFFDCFYITLSLIQFIIMFLCLVLFLFVLFLLRNWLPFLIVMWLLLTIVYMPVWILSISSSIFLLLGVMVITGHLYLYYGSCFFYSSFIIARPFLFFLLNFF